MHCQRGSVGFCLYACFILQLIPYASSQIPQPTYDERCYLGTYGAYETQLKDADVGACAHSFSQGITWCQVQYYTDAARQNQVRRTCGDQPPQLKNSKTWKDDMPKAFYYVKAQYNSKWMCTVNGTEVTCRCQDALCNGVFNQNDAMQMPVLYPGWENNIASPTVITRKADADKFRQAQDITVAGSGTGSGDSGGKLDGSRNGTDANNSSTTAKPGDASSSSSMGIIVGAVVVAVLVVAGVVGYFVYKKRAGGSDEGGSGGRGGGGGSGETAGSSEEE